MVSAQPTVGHFGILVPANTRKTKKIRESYWFAKQALGGFRQAGQPSQVRIIDVLNHGLADTIQVMVPNDQLRIFYIQPDSSFIITIAPEDM